MKKLLLILSLLFVPVYSYHGPLTHKITWAYDLTDPQNIDVTDFRIYCGIASRVYTLVVNIPDNLQRSYLIYDIQLPNGTNYCAMTAYNGLESEFSNELLLGIQDFDYIPFTPGIPVGFRTE